jgi:hypothetical protein
MGNHCIHYMRMLRSHPVRTTLGIVIRFVLWLAVLCLVTAAVVVAHAYVTGFDQTGATTPESFLDLVAHAMAQVLLGCSLVAGAVSVFSVLKRAKRPLIPLVLVGAVTAGALLLAGLFDSESRTPVPRSIRTAHVIRIGDTRIYAVSQEGLSYSPVVTHTESLNPGFFLHSEGVVDVATGELLIPSSGLELDLTESDDSYPALVEPPHFLMPVLRDLQVATRVLSLSDGKFALLTALALSLLVVSLWTLVRLTRWPLFNAVVVFGVLRLAVWIIASIHEGSLNEIAVAAVGSDSLGMVAAAVVAVVAVLLGAASILLPSLEQWRHEVANG